MERSFASEVKQLALGDGQVLRGEGILTARAAGIVRDARHHMLADEQGDTAPVTRAGLSAMPAPLAGAGRGA